MPGETALFVTHRVAGLGWYQFVAGGETHPRANDNADRDKLVERFARAVREPRAPAPTPAR